MSADSLYNGFLVFSFCLLYAGAFFLFRFFFNFPAARLSLRSVRSVALISIAFVFLSLVFYYIVDDIEFQNRLVHAFAGGFLAFIVCFLAVRDSDMPVDRIRFFILAFLTVSALGVANEIAELFLFLYAHSSYAANPLDTALDLTSNTVGALIAAGLTLPFLKKRVLA